MAILGVSTVGGPNGLHDNFLEDWTDTSEVQRWLAEICKASPVQTGFRVCRVSSWWTLTSQRLFSRNLFFKNPRNTKKSAARMKVGHTVDGRNPAPVRQFIIYPIIYRDSYVPSGSPDFWTINSTSWYRHTHTRYLERVPYYVSSVLPNCTDPGLEWIFVMDLWGGGFQQNSSWS